ncbi:MAG TPA: SGNH/GDSL hydrolase family protein [Candidatus Deferrimicrobium sp.]|nr:SGNH/GDSL hydrolase family protein [Candidatus Deferrimicrobium sp.]
MVNSKYLYLALGDSITAGYGVGFKNSFPSIYSTVLRQQFPDLHYVNLGVNGLSTGRLVSMVGTQRVGSLVSRSRIITITIGSNDLLSEIKALASGRQINVDLALANMSNNLMLLGKSIRITNPDAVVKVATIYNPLPSGPLQLYAPQAQGIIDKANQIIAYWARTYNFVPVPVTQAFRGKEPFLLGPDHFHPNPHGHRVIADLFYLS